MNYFLITLTIIGISLYAFSHCTSMQRLQIGDKAPDFTLIDQDNNTVTLSSFRGKKVALYFYPKNDTPGCTKQACSIRDNFDDLKQLDITVLGLSKGNKKDYKNFSEKYHLPFPILIATEQTLKDYNVNSGLFRLWMPKRHTFLINENGIIVAIITNTDVKNHAQQIISTFQSLQK